MWRGLIDDTEEGGGCMEGKLKIVNTPGRGRKSLRCLAAGRRSMRTSEKDCAVALPEGYKSTGQ